MLASWLGVQNVWGLKEGVLIFVHAGKCQAAHEHASLPQWGMS